MIILKVNRSDINVCTCIGPNIAYFSQCEVILSSFLGHLKHLNFCVILYCVAFVCRHFPMMQYEFWPLLTPESIPGGAPNCKMGEL